MTFPIKTSRILLLTILGSVLCMGEPIDTGTTLEVTPGIRGAVELDFPTEVDVYYQIQISEDLEAWDNEGYSIKGTGGQLSKLVSTRNLPKAFYRLRNDGDPANVAPTGPPGPQGPPGESGAGTRGEGILPEDRNDFITVLGGTTAGRNLFQLPNPNAVTFPRLNADNTVSLLSPADFKAAMGITKADVGLGQVDNTPDSTKPALGFVNVKTFGAVGNNVADDTAAIQAACDSGKNVYFPSGSYRISSEIRLNQGGAMSVVPVLRGQKFFGDGPSRSRIRQSTATANGFNVTQVGSFYFQFRDLALEGHGGNTSSGAGIKTTGIGPHNSWQIHNCYFYWWAEGINAGIEDTLISNCTFDSNVIGIWMNTAGGAAINQNTIANCPIIMQTGNKQPTVPCIGIKVMGGNGHKITGLDMGNPPLVTGIQLNGNSSGIISGISTEFAPYPGQVTSIFDGSQAGFSWWTINESSFGAFYGPMGPNDFPIIQGQFVSLHIRNAYRTAHWPNEFVKRTLSHELVTCPLTVQGYQIDIGIYTGNTRIESYKSSPINTTHSNISLPNAAMNKGSLLQRFSGEAADGQLLFGNQLSGSSQYIWDNLNQYNSDVRAGKFSTIGHGPADMSTATFSANSSYQTYTPGNAFDSSLTTYWWSGIAANAPASIKVDLGANKAQALKRMDWIYADITNVTGTIQGSNDDSTYTVVGNFSRNAQNTTFSETIASAVPYRYYKIVLGGGASWIRIFDIKFFTDSIITPGLVLPKAKVFANNSEAIAGGLVEGTVYRTANGELRIVY